MFREIMLVCTGNICRSPMAEALLRTRLEGKGIQVSSSGIAALVNRPAAMLAQGVMQARGLDISGHRARQATQELLTAADLILGLDQTHGDWICLRYPYLRGRVHKLGRWRGNMNIVDPYGAPVEAFEQAYVDIDSCIDDWIERIQAV